MYFKGGISGLAYDTHGGGCCGIIHLYHFPEIKATQKKRVEWIKQAVKYGIESEYDVDNDTWHCAVEVVLTDSQLPGWQASLEEVGFKIVFRFLNDNSGNYCNVLYLQTGENP